MNESQISVRYAKALFQSASEKQILDQVSGDMELLAEACKLNDFTYLLEFPSLQASQKEKLVRSMFEKHMSPISLSMILLIIANNREKYLSGIVRNFRDLYRKEKGIRSAELVTAVEVDEAAVSSIRELIRKAYDADVELSTLINKEVIGGFILTIEDMQYDASVSTNLRKLKKELLQTSIEKN